MHNVAEKQLVFCEECGNALHNECFGQCTFPTGSSYYSLIDTDASLQGKRRWRTRASPLRVFGVVRTGSPRARLAGIERERACVRRREAILTSVVLRELALYETRALVRRFISLLIHVLTERFADYHGPRRGQRYLGWNDYEDD